MFRFIKNNKPLRTNEVVKMACDYWHWHVTEEEDTSKPTSTMGNRDAYFKWLASQAVDTIGHAIEDLQYYVFERDIDGKIVTNYLQSIHGDNKPIFDMGVVAKEIYFNLASEKSYKDMENSLKEMKPYIDFCFYLKEQGVTAEGMGW